VPSKAPNAKGAKSPIAVRIDGGSRPRLDGAFRQLRESLVENEGRGLADTLRALGYEARSPKADRARYRRGALRLSISPLQLAEFSALQVTLRDHKTDKKKTGVLVNGVMMPKKLWTPLVDRYEAEIARFVAARNDGNLPLPHDFEALKSFALSGRTGKEQAKARVAGEEIKAGLAELAERIAALKEEGRAPRGIVFYVDGPDGAGKTSTGAIVAEAFEAAGYRIRRERFKAPTDAERARPWLERFDRGLPASGEAVLWDRGPAGDAVYGSASPDEVRAMAGKFSAWERDLRAKGILVVKVELSAEPEKQAATFGKRLARQTIADALKAIVPDAKSRSSLDEIASKIDGADFQGLARYRIVQGKYRRFIRQTRAVAPWLTIDATHRHEARLRLIAGTVRAVERFAAERP
jgi:polyphosphate kinase 2 (PPK2 family)